MGSILAMKRMLASLTLGLAGTIGAYPLMPSKLLL